MRNCDGCTYCCNGHLIGTVEDIQFGNMNACHRLTNSGCSIYENRPSMCTNYYCAWAQELFPEWMRPDLCGVVVSVEIDKENRQYLKAISNNNLPSDVEALLNTFTKSFNTYYVFVKVIKITSI